MKLIILLFAMLFGFGTVVKKTADDIKVAGATQELNQYKAYPNLLPEVEIVATRK